VSALLRAKYVTFSVLDGSFSVLQGVSIADDSSMIFATLTYGLLFFSCVENMLGRFLALQILGAADCKCR
jgi:hypothetical protein